MICQTKTGQPLRCPINKILQQHNPSDVYLQFAERFYAMGQMSEPHKDHFKLQHLFQQSSLAKIASEMSANKGVWHRVCYIKYNIQAKDRLEKRKDGEVSSTVMLATEDLHATMRAKAYHWIKIFLASFSSIYKLLSTTTIYLFK